MTGVYVFGVCACVCVHAFLMLPMLVDSSSATTNQMRFKHLFFQT